MRGTVTLSLSLFASIVLATPMQTGNSYHYPPGIELRRTFPDLPLPLYSVIEGKDAPATLSVYLPEDYTPEEAFPLFVWIGGATGGLGDNVHWARAITGNRGFVCANLPLFKAEVDPLTADESNKWSRMLIREQDARYTWEQYRVMLATLFEWLPNIDRSRTYIGGFSNGANVTAHLINQPEGEVFEHFTHFVFIEGGNRLEDPAALRGCPLIIMEGDQRDPSMFNEAVRGAGSNITYTRMQGTGHSFPETYKTELLEWMRSHE